MGRGRYTEGMAGVGDSKGTAQCAILDTLFARVNNLLDIMHNIDIYKPYILLWTIL